MNYLNMKKLSICIALFGTLIFSSVSFAKAVEFLEEKTAFCYSKDSLSKYLAHVRVRNIDGMNELVYSGECNFVPDGETYAIGDVEKSKINSMHVIAFQKDEKTLWTFKALVQSVQLGQL